MGKILKFKTDDIADRQELAFRNRKSILLAVCKNRIASRKNPEAITFKYAVPCSHFQWLPAANSEPINLRILPGNSRKDRIER